MVSAGTRTAIGHDTIHCFWKILEIPIRRELSREGLAYSAGCFQSIKLTEMVSKKTSQWTPQQEVGKR